MSSTLNVKNVASFAIDGDLATGVHSNCARNVLIWLRLDLSREYCVESVRLVERKGGYYSGRMDGTEIFVGAASAAGKCGELDISNSNTRPGKK